MDTSRTEVVFDGSSTWSTGPEDRIDLPSRSRYPERGFKLQYLQSLNNDTREVSTDKYTEKDVLKVIFIH